MMNKYPRLRHHTRKRKSGRVVTYYFYDMRIEKKNDIPLGTDAALAIKKWSEIDRDMPRKKHIPRPKYRDTKFGRLPKWAKAAYSRAKGRSARLDREFNLTREEFATIVERDCVCAVTGREFEFGGRRNPLSPSVDRIDSELGYVADNVRIVTLAANIAMSNWGESALINLAPESVPHSSPATLGS